MQRGTMPTLVAWYAGTGNLWDLEDVQKGTCELIEDQKQRCDLDAGWTEYESTLKCDFTW